EVARGAAERGALARGTGVGEQRALLRPGRTGAGAAPQQGAGAGVRVGQRGAPHLASVPRPGAGPGAGEGGAVSAHTSQERQALALALRQSCELRQSWGAPFGAWL